MKKADLLRCVRRLAPVGLWHMAYSVWFVCPNYMP